MADTKQDILTALATASGIDAPIVDGTTNTGTDGDDVLPGTVLNDGLAGGDGNDTLNGSNGDDILFGEAGTDTLNGENGDDFLIGGGGDDILNGGNDDDLIEGGKGGDTINGGSGFDTVSYSTSTNGVTVNLQTQTASGGHAQGDTLSGMDAIVGSAAVDHLTGSTGFNTIHGGDGNDKINGNGGNDQLFGEGGNDTFKVNSSRNNNSVTFDGGEGNDTLRVFGTDNFEDFTDDEIIDVERLVVDASNSHTVRFTADQFNFDTVKVDSTNELRAETVTFDIRMGDATEIDLSDVKFVGVLPTDTFQILGDNDSENIIGTQINDLIKGGNGNDVIEGGKGADVLEGNDGNDTLSYANSEEAVFVSLLSNEVFGGDATGDTVSGFENIIGSANDDLLFGSNGVNVIQGGDGDDVISGGSGADTLFGGEGNDTFAVDDAVNNNGKTYDGGAGNDTLSLSGRSSVEDFRSAQINSVENLVVDGARDRVLHFTADQFQFDTVTIEEADSQEDTKVVIRVDAKAQETLDLSDVKVSGMDENDQFEIFGTNSEETIIGTSQRDVIDGNGGDDVLNGFKGNDTLFGDDGTDTLTGGNGKDEIRGGNGEDLIKGGNGADTINGDNDNDTIYGGKGADTLLGGNGNDFVNGGNGNDNIQGNNGNDTLLGGDGDDIINGGDGNDTIEGGKGADVINGGSNFDTLVYANSNAGVTVDLRTQTVSGGDAEGDTISGMDAVIGSAFDDVLTGNGNANIIQGGEGDDIITSGGGGDTLLGDEGDDSFVLFLQNANQNVTFDGGEGIDRLFLTGTGNVETFTDDTITSVEVLEFEGLINQEARMTAEQIKGFTDVIVDAPAEGRTAQMQVTVTMGAETELDLSDLTFTNVTENDRVVVQGDSSSETIIGSSINDVINAGNGNDTLSGGEGNDTLNGGDGDDFIEGGAGADDIDGGRFFDTLVYSSSDAGVTVNLQTQTASGGHAEGDTISGMDGVIGSDFADTLTGNNNTNTFVGGAGNDVIFAEGGSDRVDSGTGDDFVDLGADGSADVFVFNKGDDTDTVVNFDDGRDTVELDAALFAGVEGIEDGADVIAEFGTFSEDGTTLTLDFGDGDTLVLVDERNGLDATTIADDFVII